MRDGPENPQKKKDARPDLILESAANKNLHVMVAAGISQMGRTQPYFALSLVEINGATYREMVGHHYFPQMSAIAQRAGASKSWYSQQDNAPAHRVCDVLASIKKHVPKSSPGRPAASPDPSPLDYFSWS